MVDPLYTDPRLIAAVIAAIVSGVGIYINSVIQSKNTTRSMEAAARNVDKSLNLQCIIDQRKRDQDLQIINRDLKLAKVAEVYALLKEAEDWLLSYKSHKIYDHQTKSVSQFPFPKFLLEAEALTALYLKKRPDSINNVLNFIRLDVKHIYFLVYSAFSKFDRRSIQIFVPTYEKYVVKYHSDVETNLEQIYKILFNNDENHQIYNKEINNYINRTLEDFINEISKDIPKLDECFKSIIASASSLISLAKQDVLNIGYETLNKSKYYND